MTDISNTNELHKLLLSGRSRKFKKGQVVHFTDGQMALSLVKSGFIMRYIIANNGSISIQSIYGPNYFYPLTLAFKLLFDQTIYDSPETIYYETMSDTEIYSIDSESFLEKVEENPVLYKDILQEAGRRFDSNIQRLENIALSNSSKRLAHQLFYYSKTFSELTKKGETKLTVPLTHSTLASVLSLARETVSHSIVELREMKLIRTELHAFILPNVEKLKEFAYE